MTTVVEIISKYSSAFKAAPTIVTVAPGRVNLIGEHIDYMGYSVLPCALNHNITIAVGRDAQHALCIHHLRPQKFNERECKTIDDVHVGQPQWANYAIASFLGVAEYIASKDPHMAGGMVDSKKPCPEGKVRQAMKEMLKEGGLRLLVEGNVPPAAGVSSSSAFVVAATLAISRAVGVAMTRSDMATLCANCERHVGTAGGGMDQAAICLSRKGMARRIDFNPLRTEAIPLPDDGLFVVCNTCREAPKAVTAATHYNKRVFECRIAAYLLLKGERPTEEITTQQLTTLTLKEVQEKLGVSMKEAEGLIAKHIKREPYSREDVLEVLGKEKVDALLKTRISPAVWELSTFFEPYRRAVHVYSEAARVFEFANLCLDKNVESEKKLKGLGELLNASDKSLTAIFDCGCPELSDVTMLAREGGAYGSRMTGAGWGGCTISLIKRTDEKKFLKHMEQYFSKQRIIPICGPANISDALFSVSPGDGASVYDGVGKQLLWETE